MMNTKEIPNDMLFKIALEYDMPTLLNFCRTSKKINNLICENNLFWFYKLRKDFDITKKVEEAKEYYTFLYQRLKNTDINQLYYDATEEGNLDLVKITLDRGANINYRPNDTLEYPLINSLKNIDIFEYILRRNPKIYPEIFSKTVIYINTLPKSEYKTKLAILQFDNMIPLLYKESRFSKQQWGIIASVLERFREKMPDVYNRRINELRTLAGEL